MLKVVTLPVSQLQTNCYLLIDEKTHECILIDPGDDGEFIISVCQRQKVKPKLILATHGHFDHIMAVYELKLVYQIPFYINKKDAFLVKNIRSSAQYFLRFDPGPPPDIDFFVKDKDTISIGSSKLRVLETPGHTPGSVCLYAKVDSILFTGDLLFADGGVGRTDFSYSNFSKLEKSIKRIFQLPENTVIYPGHGRPSTLIEEKTHHFVS